MRSKYLLVVLSVLIATAVIALVVSAGNPGTPSGPPETTSSYTLEAIFNRLVTGAAGMPNTFTEPINGPMEGTGHTLDEIMSVAPSVDDTNGATQMQVLTGRTAWGLTSAGWGLMTGMYPLAPVPKTGQTKCYTASVGSEEDCPEDTGSYPGQDGDWQKGVTWPSPRFTDNNDGTVTDNLTGLVWLKNANCLAFFSTDSTGQNNRIWSNALKAANSLASGYCGLADGSIAGDWRLPNVRELHSLVHYGFNNPAVPNTAGTGQWSTGDPFTNVSPTNYWSSTSYSGHAANAWVVYLAFGDVDLDTKDNSYRVWPVRAGQ